MSNTHSITLKVTNSRDSDMSVVDYNTKLANTWLQYKVSILKNINQVRWE